jgi:hypothetical protein
MLAVIFGLLDSLILEKIFSSELMTLLQNDTYQPLLNSKIKRSPHHEITKENGQSDSKNTIILSIQSLPPTTMKSQVLA